MKLLFYKGTRKENPSATLWDNIICYVTKSRTIIYLPYFSSENKWFCSEIIAEFLELKNSWNYTPEDLYIKYT